MDAFDAMRYLGALFVTLGLVGMAALAARRFVPGAGGGLALGGGGPGGGRRARVLQSTALDARRRLAVVRFDGKDHMLLLGATGEQVIATAHAPDDPDTPEHDTSDADKAPRATGPLARLLESVR